MSLIDGLTRIFLLDNSKDTVVEVLVEILCVVEGVRAGGAFAGHVAWKARRSLRLRRDAGRGFLAAIRGCLLHMMYRHQMSLEDVRTVEAFLGHRSGARAKAADHCTLVVS